MYKKIQKYLLLNHPLLWNMKIVPMLAFVVLINIVSLGIGFLSQQIDFNDRYGSYTFDAFASLWWFYLLLVITTIIVFILWVVSYSKNNAFNSFYPKKAKALYLEWVLSFIILFLMSIPFYSVYIGAQLKVRTYTSQAEIKEAQDILNKVKVLIPSDRMDYFRENPYDEPNLTYDYAGSYMGKESTATIIDTTIVEVVTSYPEYPTFSQFSLLNYNVNTRGSGYEDKDKAIKTVLDLLKKQDRDGIKQVLSDFLNLQKKHKLKSNLDLDTWMNLIYNPLKYPVTKENLIASYNVSKDTYSTILENGKTKYQYYTPRSSGYQSVSYYVSYDELERTYEKLQSAQQEDLIEWYVVLGILSFSLILSLCIISWRLTSGKSLLIAIISMGLINIIIGILTSFTPVLFFYSDSNLFFLSYPMLFIILFAIELGFVLSKNSQNKPKGYSNVFMNHIIWLIPVTPMLIYFIVMSLADNTFDYNEDVNWSLYQFLRDNFAEFYLGNICLAFLTIWIFIQSVVLKWKSLPEE